MTLILNLPESVEGALKQDALKRGTTPESLALDYLHQIYSSPLPTDALKTPAQAIDYWKQNGIIGSYGEPSLDSPELAYELRKVFQARPNL